MNRMTIHKKIRIERMKWLEKEERNLLQEIKEEKRWLIQKNK